MRSEHPARVRARHDDANVRHPEVVVRGQTAASDRRPRLSSFVNVAVVAMLPAFVGCAASASPVMAASADATPADITAASKWHVENRSPGETFAAIVTTSDGRAYVGSSTAAAGGLRFLTRAPGARSWAPVLVPWATGFASGAEPSLLADGDGVIVGGSEFYHLEVMRLRDVARPSMTASPVLTSSVGSLRLARSPAGRIAAIVGMYALIDGKEVSGVSGSVPAFSGETLKSVGEGIWRRDNGAAVIELAPSDGRRLEGLWFSEDGAGVAVGREGTIFEQRPGTTTWSAVDAGVTADLHAVWGRSAHEIYVVGDAGAVLEWNGSTWSRVDAGTTADLHTVGGDDKSTLIGGKGIVLSRSR